MSGPFDLVKLGLLVFFAALLQVTLVAPLEVGNGTADLLLVTVVALALLRGSITGATAGFAAGLVADTATLGTLGLTSLVLTVTGYWAGRYGEVRKVSRAHTPLLVVASATVLYALCATALHFVLGYNVSARLALVEALPPAILLNLLIATPVFALCRRLLRPAPGTEVPAAARLLG